MYDTETVAADCRKCLAETPHSLDEGECLICKAMAEEGLICQYLTQDLDGKYDPICLAHWREDEWAIDHKPVWDCYADRQECMDENCIPGSEA